MKIKQIFDKIRFEGYNFFGEILKPSIRSLGQFCSKFVNVPIRLNFGAA